MKSNANITCLSCKKSWRALVDLSLIGEEITCPNCHAVHVVKDPGGYELQCRS